MLKRFAIVLAALALVLSAGASFADTDNFDVRPVSENEFYTFIKVFSEMRGPLRVRILKDASTQFENADPLQYVEMVKNEKDVKKMLKSSGLTWDKFRELMGNILLGYFSIQPNKTKAVLLRQLANYGLALDDSEIPDEYKPLVKEVLKSEEGAMLAGAALESFLEIPAENITLARNNQSQLDRMFYTKYWKDLIK